MRYQKFDLSFLCFVTETKTQAAISCHSQEGFSCRMWTGRWRRKTKLEEQNRCGKGCGDPYRPRAAAA
jgi:hypothetical protein